MEKRKVLSLPLVTVRCWNCKHADLRESGTYCQLYTEYVLIEKDAESCEWFAPRETQ